MDTSERPPRRARTRTMVAAGMAALGLFVVLLILGIVPRLRSGRELAAAARKVQTTPPNVYVVRPEAAAEAELSLAATTQAIQDAVIYARTSGYVSRRHVDIGDRVTAGQLLAEIDSPEIAQQLRQTQADLQQSEKTLDLQKASLELARTTLARYQAADAEGAVAKQALDQSAAAHRTAQASVAAAEANVESNRANVQRFRELTSFQRVVAPFNGTVIQRNVDVGTLITAGSPTNNTAVAPTSVTGAANGLFEIAQVDALRVFVNVPQAYAPNVKGGLPVSVVVRGQIMKPVTATVTRTASAFDPGTRTLLTQVDIPNAGHHLLPGMFVYVTFKIGPSGTRWRVPATAVIFNAQGTRVVTVGAGNKLHFQDVVLGRDFGTAIDVQGGLQGDELVVKQPTVSLQEGQAVTPVAPANPAGG
ncbi:MAG: HlyD family efflux transporter periplasmic adaptor subunit [Candidatus Rokuibacteriota bacterium]|nr:MAG: HlyD family efflux transporter periplasmic adaptor subunit [Candidatus Rokubacteria bacterium]